MPAGTLLGRVMPDSGSVSILVEVPRSVWNQNSRVEVLHPDGQKLLGTVTRRLFVDRGQWVAPAMRWANRGLVLTDETGAALNPTNLAWVSVTLEAINLRPDQSVVVAWRSAPRSVAARVWMQVSRAVERLIRV